jgi:hypothetical protein
MTRNLIVVRSGREALHPRCGKVDVSMNRPIQRALNHSVPIRGLRKKR